MARIIPRLFFGVNVIFGSLAQSEVKAITKLLDSETISYKVMRDDSVLESNRESINYDLRYLFPAKVSTNVLAIEVSDEEFSRMSNDLKSKLLDYGISNELPDEYIGLNFEQIDHSDLSSGSSSSKSMYTFWNLVGAVVIIVAVFLLKILL